MTDNEIIKRLNCCVKFECKECPYNADGCDDITVTNIIDLIKRQQAEIDRLKMLFNDQQEIIADLEWTVENEGFKHLGKMYSELRAEAIKEFVERLKDRKTSYYDDDGWLEEYVRLETIDKLVKEMGCSE